MEATVLAVNTMAAVAAVAAATTTAAIVTTIAQKKACPFAKGLVQGQREDNA